MLTRTSTRSLTEQLADRFAERIRTRLLAPGSLFHARRPPSTLMRINCATAQDATFWKVFARVRTQL